MATSLRIGLDPSTRSLRIHMDDGRVPEEVVFILSSGGGDLVRSADDLLVDEQALLRRISALARLQRVGCLEIEFDAYVKRLIERYAKERVCLTEARENPTRTFGEAALDTVLRQASFLRPLTREQTRDVSRLLVLANGANFSVPGAGKTSSLLAVHAQLKAAHPETRLLVIAPRNALISWDDELKYCFGEEPAFLRLTGGAQRIVALLRDDPEYAVITYQQLPSVAAAVKDFMRRNRVHLVLDESHRAKAGMAGVQASAVNVIAPYACRRDILSGTPMPQCVGDVIAQFEFLWPGHGVCDAILAEPEEGRRLEIARQSLPALFTRTTKDELGLKMPKVTYIPVELQPRQRELYDLLRSDAARLASGMDRRDRSQLRTLGRHAIRLIQAASNPELILSSLMNPDSASHNEDAAYLLRSFLAEGQDAAKLIVLGSLVDQLLATDPAAKVVIWSVFVNSIWRLETDLERHGCVSIHGAVPTGDDEDLIFREARIRKFNEDPACRVMIANPAACGEGISLHKNCHNAIYLERTYNAAHYLQSVDRIHRLGLAPEDETNIYVLIASGSIDESVRDRVDHKIEALRQLLDDKQLTALAYDPEDCIEEIPAGLSSDDLDSFLTNLIGSGA